MNQRGQEETNGELGDFCVKCHAPLALELGATTDGTDKEDVPQHLKGVTCAFCHRAEAVVENHNNGISLSDEDDLMRGGISSPLRTSAHRSTYSPLHDRLQPESASLCGSCHDVVSPAGVHLERTFVEWQDSDFSQPRLSQLTCGNCHMRGRDGPAVNQADAPIRRVHDHSMPGVDIAITDFPEREEQLAAVQAALDSTLIASLCVRPDSGLIAIEVTLENAGAGHLFPSGSAQDRRVWVEVIAFLEGEQVFSSGVVADDEPVAELADPFLWLLRDTMFDANGEEVHMFWEAASYESNVLPSTVTLDPTDPLFIHWVTRTYPIVGLPPDRVTMRVRMRPMGLEVLGSLVDSGHLDPAHLASFPTYDLASTVIEWQGQLTECAP